MLSYCSTIVVLFVCVTTTFAQHINFSFLYYDKDATSKNVGVADVLIKIENIKTAATFEAKTNENGEAAFKLPAGHNYRVTIPSNNKTLPLNIEHLRPNAFSKFRYEGRRVAASGNTTPPLTNSASSSNKIGFTFYYYDREQQEKIGAQGVEIIVINPKTKQAFKSTTNSKGAAVFELPTGTNYEIEIPLDGSFFDLKIAHLPPNSSSTMRYSGYAPAYYAELERQDSLDAIRYAKEQIIRDSMAAKRAIQDSIAAEHAHALQLRLAQEVIPTSAFTSEVYFHFVQDLGDAHQFWEGKVYDASSAADHNKSLGKDNAYTANGTCSSVLRQRGKLAMNKPAGTYSFYAVANIDNAIYEFSGEYTVESNRTKVVYLRASKAKKTTMSVAEYEDL